MNNTSVSYKIDNHRRLCIRKDAIELNQWIDMLEDINTELDALVRIEKKFLNSQAIISNIKGLRRTNTLNMGVLCQYEQQLKKEYEYGTQEYDVNRAKEHEKRREVYLQSIQDFQKLKSRIYQQLFEFQCR